MTTPSASPLQCPFCHASIGARDAVCRNCHARRHVRTGMSPSSFRWYVTSWLVLAVPTVLLAAWMALLPWLPQGETPGYAFALVGARPVDPVPRCRVEVVDAGGKRMEVVSEGACGTPAQVTTRAAAAKERQAALTSNRMAAAVHSMLTLGGAGLACWALLRLLRRPFLQRSAPSWVRRAAA